MGCVCGCRILDGEYVENMHRGTAKEGGGQELCNGTADCKCARERTDGRGCWHWHLRVEWTRLLRALTLQCPMSNFQCVCGAWELASRRWHEKYPRRAALLKAFLRDGRIHSFFIVGEGNIRKNGRPRIGEWTWAPSKSAFWHLRMQKIRWNISISRLYILLKGTLVFDLFPYIRINLANKCLNKINRVETIETGFICFCMFSHVSVFFINHVSEIIKLKSGYLFQLIITILNSQWLS
jgi:hypothetical protein